MTGPGHPTVQGGCRCRDGAVEFPSTTPGHPAPNPHPHSRRPALQRRLAEGAGWIIPAAVLAFLPKCPACFAAYVAIGAGVGLSIPVAHTLRSLIWLFCAILIVGLAARYGWYGLRHVWPRRLPAAAQSPVRSNQNLQASQDRA